MQPYYRHKRNHFHRRLGIFAIEALTIRMHGLSDQQSRPSRRFSRSHRLTVERAKYKLRGLCAGQIRVPTGWLVVPQNQRADLLAFLATQVGRVAASPTSGARTPQSGFPKIRVNTRPMREYRPLQSRIMCSLIFSLYRMLTFMATLFSALRAKVLVEYRLPNWETRPIVRPAYFAASLMQWADGSAELIDGALAKSGRLLAEHLDQLFCDFRCSERPPTGDVRRMKPTARGILSAHAPGLRVYGWCAGPACFIGVTAALERDTKTDKRLNDQKRDEVLGFARAQNLEATIMRGELYELFPPSA